MLNLVILSFEYVCFDEEISKFIELIILNCGSLVRIFKSVIIFVVVNFDNFLREWVRNLLVWEDISD